MKITSAAITSLFDLTNTIFEYFGNKLDRKWLDQLHNKKIRLDAEENKPLHEQDDVKIETLRREIIILINTVDSQVKILTAQKK
jgi:hypothetical protein